MQVDGATKFVAKILQCLEMISHLQTSIKKKITDSKLGLPTALFERARTLSNRNYIRHASADLVRHDPKLRLPTDSPGSILSSRSVSYSASTWRAPGPWSCYPCCLKLPKATANGHGT